MPKTFQIVVALEHSDTGINLRNFKYNIMLMCLSVSCFRGIEIEDLYSVIPLMSCRSVSCSLLLYISRPEGNDRLFGKTMLLDYTP
jgi:hypothetical protein